ncbi:hypothetical protein PENSPDRAFT_746089 [Peniophora sp. CONT]|nr:hypothetical protein PENSPDRAFT_746089 [Peniophora sp. CONT]
MVSRISRTVWIVLLAVFLVGSIALISTPSRSYLEPWAGDLFANDGVRAGNNIIIQPIGDLEANVNLHPDVDEVHGGVVMPKLGNATAKAELGRATWKLLHTMTLRYPEAPTDDERIALDSYFHLFSRLYPCGECAAEFQQLLKKYPPQTSSRRSASLWLCAVHNRVNERLKKPAFDCAHLEENYDCGCADDEKVDSATTEKSKDDITGEQLIKGGR